MIITLKSYCVCVCVLLVNISLFFLPIKFFSFLKINPTMRPMFNFEVVFHEADKFPACPENKNVDR